MHEITQYINKATEGLKPFAGALLTAISYVMFPEEAYATACMALGGAMIMDIFSKYVALSCANGGLFKALKTGKIFSRTLWDGTRVKILTYLSISIMVGLSYRLNSLPEAFTIVSKFMGTVIYFVLFLREFQSMLENFKDAGANVDWLLGWAKREQEKILDKNEISNEYENHEPWEDENYD